MTLTTEDFLRSDFYQTEKKRREFKDKAEGVEAFLRGLQTKIQVEVLTPESNSIGRSVQLLSKTNQFNLTTRRHDETELRNMLDIGWIGVSIRVSDRFGDHGIVGLALAEIVGQAECRIDTFLLSCRVMGRQIEKALLSLLIAQISKKEPVLKIIGEYIETTKNQPVKDFYQEQGFSQIDASDIVRYEFDPNKQVVEMPDFFAIEVN